MSKLSEFLEVGNSVERGSCCESVRESTEGSEDSVSSRGTTSDGSARDVDERVRRLGKCDWCESGIADVNDSPLLVKAISGNENHSVLDGFSQTEVE